VEEISIASATAGGVADGRNTGARKDATRVRLWLLTGLGLAIGFNLIPAIISAHFGRAKLWHMPPRAALPVLMGLLIWLADPALLMLSVRRLERRPLRALGLAKPSLRDFGIGIGVFVAGQAFSYLFVIVVQRVAPGIVTMSIGPMAALMRAPLWAGLPFVTISAFSEELVARGYAIERFERITGSTLIAATIALVIDLAVHIPYWGWYYPLLILPDETIFVLLFLWRRNLQPCIIAHILFDAFPFLMVAMVSGHFHDLQGLGFYQDHQYARAEEEFSRALKYNPHDWYALLCRGEIYLKDRKYDLAVADLSGAISIKPSAIEYYDRMLAYLGKRDYADGQLDLARAIKSDAEQANYYKENYYSARAPAESHDNNEDAAIKDWTAAIALNPKDAGYHRSRGFSYMASHRYDEALADFSSVIQSKPGEPDVYVDRATVFSIGGDFRRARADYDTAIRLSPRNPYFYIRRSSVESGAGDHSNAISDLQTAIRLQPDRPEPYVVMGEELMDRPRPDFPKVINLLTLANDLSQQTDSNTLDKLASGYAGVGDYTSAVRFENEAISHADSDTTDDMRKGYLDSLHRYERAMSRGVRAKRKSGPKVSARKSKTGARRAQ
jgi:tetratricopeptide (TPR) repeat protein/membrane protease YdiL (CAAX protease family)